MASATTDSQEHLAPPVNPPDLSRSASPQQSSLNSLVPNHNTAEQSPTTNNAQTVDTPSADQTASTIQSILETTTRKPRVPHTGPPPTWMDQKQQYEAMNAQAGPSTVPSRTSTKRKLDPTDAEDPNGKIRRVVRDHVLQDPARVMPMTTVLCLHAAVAQKSYGSEKRFLCPPPVVHIEGPVWNMKQQQLSVAVVSEGGERAYEQKAPLDHNLTASFKFLHVTGSAKTKSFQLSLDIAEPAPPATDGSDVTTSGRVWASFDSAPVTIISKPSKKTAKTRNITSCILAGGPVSLFNRINSQTVRTKYMTVERSQLSASNVAWSAFNVNVTNPPQEEDSPLGTPQPVTYGSEIVLVDTVSGTQTAPLIIRKVDKGRIAADDGGPVSQMQKIALQRVSNDSTRHYLSAVGPVPGTPGLVISTTPGLSNQTGTHPLLFQIPRVREETKDGLRVITDEVDDYLCWTIVGISKFQYTFFDAFGQNTTIPDLPITPFPTLFTAPVYRPGTGCMELTVANFFYEDPSNGNNLVPLDVYVGTIGPLRVRVYQAAPMGMAINHSPFLHAATLPENTIAHPVHFVPTAGTLPREYPPAAARYTPHGPVHTVVLVELPPVIDLLKALQDDALPANGEVAGQQSPGNGESPMPLSKVEEIMNRSLPLLFIRTFDGVGYHSGRAIALDNVFQNMDLGNGNANADTDPWLAAAQAAARAAAQAEGDLHGWAVRVI
ncbi:hypothetical protein AcW1_000835 [Taiwanofungus camphoratus]|nr:hypothetical protein AcW1_000835 [Antrodia cinnamomea]